MKHADECRRIYGKAAHFFSNTWRRIVRYINSKRDERTAKQKAESPTDKAARRTAIATVWMAIFTFVLAVTSGLTILLLVKGGGDTHTLAESAKKQADKTETISSSITQAVQQLTTSATAAQDSVCGVKRQMQQAERAWIKVGYGEMRIAFPLPAEQSLKLTNVGKSPAKKVVTRAVIIPAAPDKLPIFDLTNHEIVATGSAGREGLMFPNDEWGFIVNTGQPIISPMDKMILGGMLPVITYGQVDYTDIFGVAHWIRFCTERQPAIVTPAKQLCSDYNDTDNQQTDCGKPN